MKATPQSQERRLVAAEPLLPRGIAGDVGPVVIEQVHLDVALAGTAQERESVGPQVRVVQRYVRANPTCRWRVASKDKKFARRAASFPERSALKSRRVCQSGPNPSS